jgi:energy-converting hydrogenase Eha subunit B
MLCEPEVDGGTSKVALQPPWELAVISEATGVPSKVTVMPVSLAPKPEPVTVTELPAAPLDRLMDMPGVTVKVISGTLAVTEPYAPITCEPEAEAGTTKAALQLPWELAMIFWATGVPSKVTVMPVSLAAKLKPVTVTALPAAPLDRLMDMPGVTVKVILGTLVVTEPYAPITCEPEAEAGTTKAALQLPWE